MGTEAAPAAGGTDQAVHCGRPSEPGTPFIGALGTAGGEPGNEHRPLSASQCPQEAGAGLILSHGMLTSTLHGHTPRHTRRLLINLAASPAANATPGISAPILPTEGFGGVGSNALRDDSQNKSNPGANFAASLPDLGRALCGRRWGAATRHGERSALGEQAVTGGRR